jgi:hypothetical protein
VGTVHLLIVGHIVLLTLFSLLHSLSGHHLEVKYSFSCFIQFPLKSLGVPTIPLYSLYSYFLECLAVKLVDFITSLRRHARPELLTNIVGQV